MSLLGTLLVGAVILVGLVGIVVPVLPGALLVLVAILAWAAEVSSTAGWVTFSVALGLIAVSQVVKYTIPGRQMHDRGVPRASLLVGVLLGIVGFFVIPVVGLFIGFPAGIYLAERRRLGAHADAWSSTRHALRAIGVSILIELAGALLAAGTWLVAVLFLE
jgi:uncharacterized protein YqgC (DUF456 family)